MSLGVYLEIYEDGKCSLPQKKNLVRHIDEDVRFLDKQKKKLTDLKSKIQKELA